MKLVFIFISFQLVLGSEGAMAQRADFVLAETGKPIRITLTKRAVQDEAYTEFQIDNGVKRFYFHPKDPIIRIPATHRERQDRAVWANISGLRMHPSRFFLVGDYVEQGTHHTLLFLLSEGYASDAAPLVVIAFLADGSPYKALEREFDLTAFKAAANKAILIGKTTLSQGLGCVDSSKASEATATTYDPFAVFFIEVGSKAVYSLTASRAYNQQHYVWAGPHSREDYLIFYNLPGRPKLFGAPASQLSTLLGPCK